MKLAVLAAAVATAAIAVPASATVILFSNFDSVSTPALSSQGYDASLTTADGWTGGPTIEVQTNSIAGAPFSSPNLVELDTTANSSMFVNLTRLGRYTVSYYYSPRINQPSSTNGISLSLGSTQLDTVTAVGGASTDWQLRTVSFTNTVVGTALTFAAFGTSDGVGGYLDNITLSAVPEPMTWGLMLAGFAMVGFAARRRAAGNVAA